MWLVLDEDYWFDASERCLTKLISEVWETHHEDVAV